MNRKSETLHRKVQDVSLTENNWSGRKIPCHKSYSSKAVRLPANYSDVCNSILPAKKILCISHLHLRIPFDNSFSAELLPGQVRLFQKAALHPITLSERYRGNLIPGCTCLRYFGYKTPQML